jgi:hypothetical protein
MLLVQVDDIKTVMGLTGSNITTTLAKNIYNIDNVDIYVIIILK